MMQAHPDCCDAPELAIAQRLDETYGGERDLCCCRTCGAYWRRDNEERMNFSGGEDTHWEWYVRLTAAEAAALRAIFRT